MTGSRRAARRSLSVLCALVLTLALVPAATTAAATAPDQTAPAQPASTRHQITYDKYSLQVDGKRVFLWSGEFHYFRLPSPGLWRDVLERIKASGFNGVSLYFHWGYHSPKPGVYDFTGVRDVDRLLRMTEELGLYTVVRPGPYINAETTGGGFPAWLKTVPGRARSSDPGYTEAYRDWLAHINPIIARHQLTRGGSVVAYNVENEYAINTDRAYMEDLQAQARAAGIDVPITHNQCCDAASWTTDWSTGQGAVQIPGVDDYPQSFNCQTPDVWGTWGQGVTERTTQNAPVYAAEYQAGSIDAQNAGFDKCRELTGPNFMKVFYKSNLIESGATMFGYYMAFGGTNWGWLAQPNDVGTSYDYGAAITENRQLTAKAAEFKRQGLFVTTVAPLAKTDPAAAAPASSNAALHVSARANPDTGTQFVLVRQADRTTDADETTTLTWTAPDGTYTLPVRIKGRDAKVLVGGYDLGGQRLAASTSEILTHTTAGGRDIAVLYGTEGVPGTTVLRYGSRPSVKVLSGDVRSSYDNGDLKLDYTHEGLARVLVTGGGRRPLLLLLGTDAEAAKFWKSGDVLVRGSDLVRSARVAGGTADVRADFARTSGIEVFAPVQRLVVNGQPVGARGTSSGSLAGTVAGPKAVRLPALTGWQTRTEAPEARPDFDDSRWTVADKTTTLSPIKPKQPPVLYADEYGFHHGHVWYRGHFTATGAESEVNLNGFTGKGGRYQVWLNGRYLGSAAGASQMDTDPDNPTPVPNPGAGDFPVPAGLLKPGEKAVLSVLVGNMGHNDDWIANETRHRQPRGLVNASIAGSAGPVTWKVQGARGGEDLADRLRGPLNNGGLHGERSGWHLPGFDDRSWAQGSPVARRVGPGITWYRTKVKLDLPKGQDVPLALRFGGGTGDYRVLVFLNGWHIAHFTKDRVQTEFTLPAGVLKQRGSNTLALAVVADGTATVGPLSLTAVANHRGGVPVPDVTGGAR